MSRFIDKTTSLEDAGPAKTAPTDERRAPLDEASKDGSARHLSASGSVPSFLTILLRALSAWNA